MMADYEVTEYEGEHIKKEDFISPFRLNRSHYYKVNSAREKLKYPLRGDFIDVYDRRIGHDITGKKLNTRHHELHDYILTDLNTGTEYEIDIVSSCFYKGTYIQLVVVNNKGSHRVVLYKNINSKCEVVISACENFEKSFSLKKK